MDGRHKNRTEQDYVGARNDLIYRYKNDARLRGLEFSLTKEEFLTLTKSNCFYCGTEPKQIHRRTRSPVPYVYNGIDRLNNKIGYIPDNCVPCCGICNVAKNNRTLEEFKDWINKVYMVFSE
jgi:hypothetical protein